MRLDTVLVQAGLTATRSNAARLIREGKVKVDGTVITKASFDYKTGEISVVQDRFVSRAGEKLQTALNHFHINVNKKKALDIGASTGGFTDCLLENGAECVIAVDVGTMQLSPKLKADSRVISMENTNARYLKPCQLPFLPELIVMDVSFISQTLIYDAITDILTEGGELVSLIKPQFEVGKNHLGKGGIVRDKKQIDTAVKRIIDTADEKGLKNIGIINSPIKGGDGNSELLAYFVKK